MIFWQFLIFLWWVRECCVLVAAGLQRQVLGSVGNHWASASKNTDLRPTFFQDFFHTSMSWFLCRGSRANKTQTGTNSRVSFITENAWLELWQWKRKDGRLTLRGRPPSTNQSRVFPAVANQRPWLWWSARSKEAAQSGPCESAEVSYWLALDNVVATVTRHGTGALSPVHC